MSLYWFIASDYPMQLVDYRKEKFYKLKSGVKTGIDNEGKWYHYTNESDKNSLDLLIPCDSKGASRMVVNNEEDLGELHISTSYKNADVEWHTKKNNIYNLDLRYSDKRASDLINYLKENVKIGYEIELWSTWMGEHKNAIKYFFDIEKLTIRDIKVVFGGKGCNTPECIVISKKE